MKKTFGRRIEGTDRYISGEKGLGFFSVFKFGNRVRITTVDKSNDEYIYSFMLNMKNIIQHADISDMEVKINKKKNTTHHQGTSIIIDDLKEDVFKVFKDELVNEKIKAVKLCHVIDNPTFKIVLTVDGKNVGNTGVQISEKFNNQQIGYINYDSFSKDSGVIVGFYDKNKDNTTTESFTIKNKLLANENFKLKIDIKVFNLKGSSVKSAPEIYLENNKLKPLIYINDVIFETSELYNIEINASRKVSEVFRQQIGKISIFLEKADILQFNSDRTAIIEDENYKCLVELLNEISSKGQKVLRRLIKKSEKENNKVEVVNQKLKKKDNHSTNQKIEKDLQNSYKKSTDCQKDHLKKDANYKINIGTKKKPYDFFTLEGYKGKNYEFINLISVGELFKEIRVDNKIDKRKKLLYLIIIRPIYEACKNIFESNKLIAFNNSDKLESNIKKMSEYIVENKQILTKVCKKVGNNDELSFTTILNSFSTIHFYEDVKAANVFVHRQGEGYKSFDAIKEYLHNVFLFSVIVDRWITVISK